MIPKKIHYCWFGNSKLPASAQKCIESWKKFLPDYEIVEWNESNFDITCCQYVKEAYEAKKWAFVSDYARFKILFEHGGLYLDTDVEVIKNFDDIIKSGAFFGCENRGDFTQITVNPGLGCACEKQNDFYKEMLEMYEHSSFFYNDGTLNLRTIVERTTDMLKNHGLKNSTELQVVSKITIYPTEYFCPINMKSGELVITEKTCSIHRFDASWESKQNIIRGKIYRLINRVLGQKTADFVRSIFGKNKNEDNK